MAAAEPDQKDQFQIDSPLQNLYTKPCQYGRKVCPAIIIEPVYKGQGSDINKPQACLVWLRDADSVKQAKMLDLDSNYGAAVLYDRNKTKANVVVATIPEELGGGIVVRMKARLAQQVIPYDGAMTEEIKVMGRLDCGSLVLLAAVAKPYDFNGRFGTALTVYHCQSGGEDITVNRQVLDLVLAAKAKAKGAVAAGPPPVWQ